MIVIQPWKDVDNDLQNYDEKLITRIKQATPKARVFLYMWRARPNSKPSRNNKPSSESIALNTGTTLVPAAWAWAAGQTARPEPERKDLAWGTDDGWGEYSKWTIAKVRGK